MVLRWLLLWVATFFAILPAAASADAGFDAPPDAVNLWSRAEVLRDATGLLDLNEVRNSPFRPADSLTPDPRSNAFHPSILWFRIHAPQIGRVRTYLRLSPQVSYADLFVISKSGLLEHTRFGMLVPSVDRTLPSTELIAAVRWDARADEPIYVRVVTPLDRFSTFDLWTKPRFLAHQVSSQTTQLLALAVTVGMTFALGLLAVVLASVLRNATFAWYAAAMLMLSFYALVASRFAWRVLWPFASVPYDPPLYVTYLAYLALLIAFSGTLLGIAYTASIWWRLIRVGFALAFVCATLTVVSPNLLARWHVLTWLAPAAVTLCLVTVLGAGIAVWLAMRYRLSLLFCIAFAGGIIGLVIDVCVRSGLMPATAWSESAAGIGAAFQAFVLSISLAERALGSAARAETLQEERDDLEAVALRDALTGVWNRRAFEQRLADEWQRCSRGRMNLAVVLFDVDHFKAYNDAYGHLSGDRALTIVARRMAQALRRPYDLIARYGGEEFVLLLPGCGLDDAKWIGEHARMAVHAAMIPHPTSERGIVTVSAGVAGMIPNQEDDPATLIASADRALYAAKREGRDRVVVAGAA